jgi:Flp pilus assembly protein TadD
MRRGHVGAVLALVVVGAVLYAQTLDDEWHFDDASELDWPGVRQFAPETSPAHYRGVLPLYLWALNYRVSGEDGWSYHLLNVLIHLANAVLVYAMAWMLAGRIGSRPRIVAVTAGLVFCAHPIATQAVTYVTQRSTSLAAFFLLASLVCWIALRKSVGARKWVWLAASLAAFLSGTHTKHVAFVVPVLLLGYELVFPAHGSGRRAVAIATVAFLLLTAWRASVYAPWIARLVTARPGETVVATSTTQVQLVAPRYSTREYAMTQPRVIATYFRLLVLPVGQNLDHDVDSSVSARDPRVAFSLLLIAAIAGSAWGLRRRRPVLSFGVLLAFVALAPTSSVIASRDLLFEHRVYVPLVGFALVVGDVLSVIRNRWGAAAWVIPIGLTLALGSATWRRNTVWDTELSLWSDVVAKSPDKARPHVNLGLALQSTEMLHGAEGEYRRALELDPDHPPALNNLGNIYRSRGEAAEAERLLRAAVESSPHYLEPYVNLGNLAMDRGDAWSAEGFYRKALELDSTSVVARYDLGKCYEVLERWEDAVYHYARVVAARPENAQFVNDLGCAQLASGNPGAAEATMRRAVELAGESAVVWYNLGLVLEARGADGGAARAFEAALAREPALQPARDRLEVLRGTGTP